MAAKTRYRITFDRIGRNHRIEPLEVTTDAPITGPGAIADKVAEAVYRYARPHLASRDVEVTIAPNDTTGKLVAYISVGWQNGGQGILELIEDEPEAVSVLTAPGIGALPPLSITATVRDRTIARDGNACVMCGARRAITARARRSADALKPKTVQKDTLTPADLVTLCDTCDQLSRSSADEFESACGLGIRVRNYSAMHNDEVPLYWRERAVWALLGRDGSTTEITAVIARERVAMATGGTRREGVSA